MNRVEAILAAALAISQAGCVLRGKPKTAAVVPPPPLPVVAAPAPAPPPEKLSIPQTQVTLPPQQPLDPDALAAGAPPAAPAENPAPVAPRTRSRSVPRQEAAPPVAPPVGPPVAEPRPPIQEVVPAAEQKRLQESAQARKREIRQWLDNAGRKRLNRHQQSNVERIRAFLKDSDDAERRGDMREADALAERAQILLRELQNAQ